MVLFLDILVGITGPIVVLIGLGWLLQPRLRLDIDSLSRLLVQVVLPAFFVHYLSTSKVSVDAAWDTAWFTAAQFVGLTAIGAGAAALLGLRGAVPAIAGLATALSNSGNFGLPLAELAFGPDMILHQAVVVSVQSIFVFTAAPVLLRGGTDGWQLGFRNLLNPIYPAILLGLALNAFDLTLPWLAAAPLEMLGGLYTPLALVTLGAQLAAADRRVPTVPLTLTTLLKLAMAPLFTAFALGWLGLDTRLEDLLIVTSAAPVGVTLAIVAAQAERGADLAAASVVLTTLLSPLTVTLCLLLLQSTG